jgi:hypothetical protein
MGAWARIAGRLDDAFDAIVSWDVRTVDVLSQVGALRPLSRLFTTASLLGDGYLWGGVGLGLILFGRPIDRIYVLIGLGVSIVNVALFRFIKVLVGR